MKDELTDTEYTTMMTELTGRLVFTQSLPTQIEEKYLQCRQEDEKNKNQCTSLNHDFVENRWLKSIRADTTKAASNYLTLLSKKTETFPTRHIQNLKLALENNHPEWRGKLDAIIEKLGNGSIFILTGPRGTGKTQLATATGRYLAEMKSRESSYTVLGDLFTKIKGTFKPESKESEEGIINQLSRTSLLVLDECHEMTGTEWQGRILTLLIDSRYREKRDTIMITNHAKTVFLNAVGISVSDRIEECGYFIECLWPSFRRRQ